MLAKTANIVLIALLISLPLLAISVVISYVFTGSIATLGFVLFVIGAIPIFLYLPSLFSSSTSGAIHTPKVIYRLVETLERKGGEHQSRDEKKQQMTSTLSIILSGVILWFISFIIQV